MRYGLSLRVSTAAALRRLFSRYCIPMDNDRPSLDIKYLYDVSPDENGMSGYKLDGPGIHIRDYSSSCDRGIHQI